MKKYEAQLIPFRGRQIPARVYRERRMSVRYYLGKKGAVLRLPIILTPRQVKQYQAQFAEWVIHQLEKKQNLGYPYASKTYSDGDSIQVGKREYILRIIRENRKTNTGKLEGNTMFLKLNPESSPQKIATLLSSLIARDFFPEICRRINWWNDRYFKQEIGVIRLKYTHTVWGSCSKNRNINLSTRLLFAPPEVLDYVIVHELAHLIEPNHSRRFWDLVGNVMPDYRDKEKWLKEFGDSCDF